MYIQMHIIYSDLILSWPSKCVMNSAKIWNTPTKQYKVLCMSDTKPAEGYICPVVSELTAKNGAICHALGEQSVSHYAKHSDPMHCCWTVDPSIWPMWS